MATTQFVTTADAIEKLGDQLYRILDVPEGADLTANAEMNSALNSANSRIESALRLWYALPVDVEIIPAELKQPAVDLFRWYLLGIKQQSVSTDDRLRYEDAEKYLTRLAKREEILPIPGLPSPDTPHGFTAVAGRTGQNDASYDGYFAGVGYDGLGPARRC